MPVMALPNIQEPQATGENVWVGNHGVDADPHLLFDKIFRYAFSVVLSRQQYCSNSTKMGVFKYQEKLTHSVNSHSSSQRHRTCEILGFLNEINIQTFTVLTFAWQLILL